MKAANDSRAITDLAKEFLERIRKARA